MADVVFITPNSLRTAKEEPIGTLLLTTILRSNGISVCILPFAQLGDPANFPEFLNTATRCILAEQPKIVSFYTRCDTYHIMIKMAQQLKSQSNVYVVFGGPQADISATDTLSEIPCVDFICQGEGETTITPFFSSLLQGAPDLSVPGLVFRKDGQVLQNPRPSLIEDLDTLPQIDYSILSADDLSDNTQPFPIDVGRGCPFGCTYCSTKSFWGRKYRLKSPQRIRDEVKRIHELYGTTYFVFAHDMFTLNREKVIETSYLLKGLDFPLSWRCSARIDCLDEELIDIMSECGMKSIFIGIETGSPRMQKLINKNLKLERVLPLLTYIRSKGIEIDTSFIYGFPEETEEDLSQTLALITDILAIKDTTVYPYLCTFLPGTELSRTYLSQLTPSVNYSDITGGVAVPDCQDLIEAHPNLFWHFREYKTELRTRLEYFSVFIRVWIALQPVYAYLSKHYSCQRMIDMYFDFVRLNRETLLQTPHLNFREQTYTILKDDRFAKSFAPDEYQDIIADFYRMQEIRYSDKLKNSGMLMDVYCFSPLEIKKRDRLEDYQRGISVVTYAMQPDGTIQTRIQSK